MRSAANAILAGLGAAGFIAAGAVAASTQSAGSPAGATPTLTSAVKPPFAPMTPMAGSATPVTQDENSEPPPSPDPEPEPEPTKPPDPEPTKPPDPEPTTPKPPPTKPGPVPKPPPTKPGPAPAKPPKPGPAKPPELFLGLTTSSAAVAPGGSVTATVSVSSGTTTVRGARLSLSPSKGSASPSSSALGDIAAGSRSVSATVTIPTGTTGSVTLLARVTADKGLSKDAASTITVTTNPSSVVPPPTSGSANPPVTGTAPQIALPPVAPPSLAPGQVAYVPNSALRSAKTALGTGLDDVTAMQAGWLAALLVGNGLLLFRARLGRISVRVAQSRRGTPGAGQ